MKYLIGEVPLCWALEMEREEWPLTPVLVVHAVDLWVEPTSATAEEMLRLRAEANCEVALVNPCSRSVD